MMVRAASDIADRIKYLNGSLARAKNPNAVGKIKAQLEEALSGQTMLHAAQDEVTAALADVAEKKARADKKAKRQ